MRCWHSTKLHYMNKAETAMFVYLSLNIMVSKFHLQSKALRSAMEQSSTFFIQVYLLWQKDLILITYFSQELLFCMNPVASSPQTKKSIQKCQLNLKTSCHKSSCLLTQVLRRIDFAEFVSLSWRYLKPESAQTCETCEGQESKDLEFVSSKSESVTRRKFHQ